MSELVDVSTDWLSLREAEDARTRSPELAQTAAGLLGTQPIVVHDLGSGTGSMMRWLAPLLPGPQTWVLHDWNARLLDHAINDARPSDRDGAAVAITTNVGELADLDAADLAGASLVTASALLDVLTLRESEAIVRACVAVGSAALLTLSVTGDVELSPADPRDGAFRSAFNEHQQRSRGDHPLLGPLGARTARTLFEQAGWNVRTVDVNWQLGNEGPALLAEWLGGWLDAAVEENPDLVERSPGYRRMRESQCDRGFLGAVIHHIDLLAWPQ